ncbi:hypothetical protein X801_08587 [Opisthorchis viverrini]|uniref:Uncharacterized protein n=1 Tax=Opisthorchis viverrini TaxID=6198 RepID=A0A1S8WMK9_OPIVI|nr:hypothetical protein X801_08587 [Opisthorchis viverrini]
MQTQPQHPPILLTRLGVHASSSVGYRPVAPAGNSCWLDTGLHSHPSSRTHGRL